ncbi:MAG: alpha/beta hydrolase [Acidimicrobiales bacterium]
MDDVPRTGDVEPDIRRYLESPLAAFPDVATSTAAEVRAHFTEMRTVEEMPDVAEVSNTVFKGPGGDVPVRVYRSGEPETAVILWFHGGGWVLGDLDTAELPARSLCAQTGCTVLSVGYRLAPEARFPGAVEDCLASLKWARTEAGTLRIDPDRLIVGGDSAGANLAAVVAVAERDARRSLLGQLLIYPVIEPKTESGGYGAVGEGYGLSEAAMDWFWDHYVPEAADRSDWRVNLSVAELSGAPDAFVLTCGYDPLAAEGIRFASRLAAAGVSVVTEHLAGAIHGVFATNLDAGFRSRAAASAWVRSLIDNRSFERG